MYPVISISQSIKANVESALDWSVDNLPAKSYKQYTWYLPSSVRITLTSCVYFIWPGGCKHVDTLINGKVISRCSREHI